MTWMLVSLSSAPVGSSASRMSGLLTRARAMATRCIWPPDISVGRLWSWSPEAHLPQRLGGTAAALSARHARDGQGQLDVGEDGLVGDEVIALEHEADGVVAVGVPVPVGVAAGGDAVDDELAAVVAVEAADDVEQRGLARAAGAEDGDKFAVAQVEADPVERCLCQIAGGVFLFDIDKLKHWPAFPAAERGSVCWPIPPGICGRRGET